MSSHAPEQVASLGKPVSPIDYAQLGIATIMAVAGIWSCLRGTRHKRLAKSIVASIGFYFATMPFLNISRLKALIDPVLEYGGLRSSLGPKSIEIILNLIGALLGAALVWYFEKFSTTIAAFAFGLLSGSLGAYTLLRREAERKHKEALSLVAGISIALVFVFLTMRFERFIFVLITSFGGSAMVTCSVGIFYAALYLNAPLNYPIPNFPDDVLGGLAIGFVALGIFSFIRQWKVTKPPNPDIPV